MKMLKLTPICLLCVILLFAGSAQQIRSHHTPGDGSDAHPIVDLGNSAYASGGWSSATVEPSISAVDLGDSTYEYDGTGNVELSGRESKSAYLYRTLSEIGIEVTVSITFNPGVAKISVPGFGEVSTPSITHGGTIKIKKTGIHRSTSSLNIYASEKHGGVVLYFDSKEHLRKAYFLSPIGWNSLAVRLYLRAEHSDAFVPVYPQQRIPFADVTVWEIHYPSDINRVDKYLATELKNKRAR